MNERKAILTDRVSEQEFSELKKTIHSEQLLAFKVASGSMEPLIRTGEVVVVRELKKPEIFDILVFHQNSQLICHFVKSINSMPDSNGDRVYVTAGLANPKREDLPLHFPKILGVVVSHRLKRWTKLKLVLKAFFGRYR